MFLTENPLEIDQVVEKMKFHRLLKNAQMQGSRDPEE
jgi:hypothetical protein